MASRNVETLRATHQAFNRRDFEAVAGVLAPEIVFTDVARGLTVKAPEEFVDLAREWVEGFSDARITDARYTDAGDTVVATYVGRGVNDGPLGPLPPTGRRVSLQFCEVVRFDAGGRIIRGETYYDQLSLLIELGHADQPPAE